MIASSSWRARALMSDSSWSQVWYWTSATVFDPCQGGRLSPPSQAAITEVRRARRSRGEAIRLSIDVDDSKAGAIRKDARSCPDGARCLGKPSPHPEFPRRPCPLSPHLTQALARENDGMARSACARGSAEE